MDKLFLVFFVGIFQLPSIAQSNHDPLKVDHTTYTGFYDVGTKPGKSRFMARIYLDDNRLMFSAPGGADSEITGYSGNHRFEGDDGYTVQFKVDENKAKSFILYRPRDTWPTDLYGNRNADLDKFAESRQLALTNKLDTKHFTIRFNVADSENARSIAKSLEANYQKVISKFQVSEMPNVKVSIYSDFENYHMAVLSPGAPNWQKGMAWATDDIRMVSPNVLEGDDREFAQTGAAVHEFVHCVNMQLASGVTFPRWLWEGVAMYVGCCQFYQFDQLDYLKAGKRPSLTSNKNQQRAYELGYFAVEYVESAFGWHTVIDLLKKGGDTKEVLGQSQAQFERGFYDYLQSKYAK